MKPTKELEQQYVDSYKKEPPVLFSILIALGTIFGGLCCIFAIYGIVYLILSKL
jgi:hypothetical protein